MRFHANGRWRRLSYPELEQRSVEIARGLIALGVGADDRVAILSNTRAEWTVADLAVLFTGAAVVPVYQSNSAEETEHVLRDCGARVVFCEDDQQLEKIDAVRDRLPQLEHVLAFAGTPGRAMTLGELVALGELVDPQEIERHVAATRPGDACTIVYTSGTTGEPKGCVLTHANVRANIEMVERRIHFGSPPNTVYLWLPLAHVLARMVQFLALHQGAELAYWRRDPRKILDDLADLHPTHLPSVPRLFEKIHSFATRDVEGSRIKSRLLGWALDVGHSYQQALERGSVAGVRLGAAHLIADRLVLRKIRRPFGSRLKLAVTGAAPVDREILRFFHAAGVRVLEGYGMTETTAVATVNTVDDYRFGTVGKPLPGSAVGIAEDGEVLIRGPHVFAGYFGSGAEPTVDGWLETGDLGSIDEDGFLTITGRKKDLIITSSGKNVTPASIEKALEQSRWISHAIVYGDRRPYLTALITLDPAETPALAETLGITDDPATLPTNELARDEIQRAVDEANARFARIEQIKRFVILTRDLSEQAGELTPTGKVKRSAVYDRYGHALASMYDRDASTNGAAA
ncbi:MAG: AMP-dependent synthetase/ligase [Actinomycetota bacterium]|nr:AMP-dependent synthetase/ligase [Actinomycetota bacterium]